MSLSDTVADMLTCVRNACRAKHRKVDVPASTLKIEIAKVLLKERFINNFKRIEDRKQGILRIYLRYNADEESVISGLRRISKPSRRVYVRKSEVPRVLGGLGIAVLSTSRGILTDKECRQLGVGGEVICHVW